MESKDFFKENGYYISRELFSKDEVAEIREHFMEMRKEGPKPGDMGGDAAKGDKDPLNLFPRFINMHKWDKKTDRWRSDPRLTKTAADLVSDQVKLCQTMLYFKPPGARGQGLHQDNQYIRQFPIVAAWIALDRCDASNGQMVVVPGSNKLGILQTEKAAPERSFTGGQTKMPEGANEVGLEMEEGDVLFFGGFTIHGSYPNETKDRFRRAFIVHYIAENTETLKEDPLTSMSGVKPVKP